MRAIQHPSTEITVAFKGLIRGRFRPQNPGATGKGINAPSGLRHDRPGVASIAAACAMEQALDVDWL